MKPTTISTIEHRLAHKDRQARGQRAFPITDYFFRGDTDTSASRTQGRETSVRARRAFRRMIATMMTKKDRHEWSEIIAWGIIIALIAWPLLELIITLAQTANG